MPSISINQTINRSAVASGLWIRYRSWIKKAVILTAPTLFYQLHRWNDRVGVLVGQKNFKSVAASTSAAPAQVFGMEPFIITDIPFPSFPASAVMKQNPEHNAGNYQKYSLSDISPPASYRIYLIASFPPILNRPKIWHLFEIIIDNYTHKMKFFYDSCDLSFVSQLNRKYSSCYSPERWNIFNSNRLRFRFLWSRHKQVSPAGQKIYQIICIKRFHPDIYPPFRMVLHQSPNQSPPVKEIPKPFFILVKIKRLLERMKTKPENN